MVIFNLRMPKKLLSNYVPLFDHVTKHIALTRSSGAFAMFEVDGLPVQTLDLDVLYRMRRGQNHSICGLTAHHGVQLYSWVCRGFAPPSIYPEGEFRTAFSRNLDEKYRRKLLTNNLYLNRTYIGILLRPPKLAGEAIGERVQIDRSAQDEPPIERVRRLARVCDIMHANLEPYKPRRLGLREDQQGRVFVEMAEALAFAMTGVWRSIGLQDNRRIGSLFSERFITGPEAIEIRGPGSSSWAACFGSQHMMWRCPPGALDGFLIAPFRSTITNSFRILGMHEALKRMSRKQNRMVSAGDRAFTQIKELDTAQDEVQANRMVLGDHHLVATVFTEDIDAMRQSANDAWHVLQDSGCQVAREDDALEAAWLSMLPENGKYRPRPGAATSWNFASLASLHAFPSGRERGQWGAPLAMFRTTGGTPYRYHLQTRSGVGGTFVFGESGSGKTAWLAFLITQCERLGIQVVLWDKDRGLELVTRACHGCYMSLRDPSGAAPLKGLTNSTDDIRHLAQLVRGVVNSPIAHDWTAEEHRRLFIGLRGIMALPPQDRWMADLRAFLGHRPNGAGDKLRKWCWGQEYGGVIDCPEDEVDLNAPVLGFDVTKFLNDHMVVGPIMSDLLYRTGKLADGRRILYIVDEGWKVVEIPAFADDAMNHFKTDRKLNAAMIFGTQSIADALNSRIGHTIREQCKTIIGFAVERPDRADFKRLNYSDRECDILEELQPGSGMFLLSQDRSSVVCQLQLHGMDDELAVLSGNEINVQVMDRVREQIPDSDPDAQITAFHMLRKQAA